MEKYREGQGELQSVIVYDRVLKKELWYCMRNSGQRSSAGHV